MTGQSPEAVESRAVSALVPFLYVVKCCAVHIPDRRTQKGLGLLRAGPTPATAPVTESRCCGNFRQVCQRKQHWWNLWEAPGAKAAKVHCCESWVLLLSLPHGVKFPLRLSFLVPNFSVLDGWGDTGNRLPVFFCDPSLPFEPYRVFWCCFVVVQSFPCVIFSSCDCLFIYYFGDFSLGDEYWDFLALYPYSWITSLS